MYFLYSLDNTYKHLSNIISIFDFQSTSNCPSQETEVTSTPTRPVDNVVITTKGLQDRNINILDGKTVENKGKLILSNQKVCIKQNK